MFDLMYAEMLKLKKSKTIVGILISCMFFPVFWFLITPFNNQKQTWVIYTSNSEDIMFMIIGVIVFILLSSYIFLREYSDNTINSLFTYPVSKISILISKILTIYIIIAVIYFLHFTLVFASGLIVVREPLTKEILLRHFSVYLTSMIFQFSVIPMIVFLVNLFKNTTVSAIIAVFAFLSNCYMYEVGKYKFWPFMLLYVPVMSLNKTVDIGITAGFAAIIFAIGIGVCIFQLSIVKDV